MNDLSQKNDDYYASARKDMLKYVDFPVRSVLEVGCGRGNFALNFPAADYWGVEPEPNQAQIAGLKNLKILTGTYEDVSSQIPNEYFDLIVCNDVIEHMVDPIGFLQDVKQKLKPDGKLIASIPNIRHVTVLFKLIWYGEFDYENSGIMDYTHLHFFTPKSFCKIAQNCGWNIEILEPLTVAPFKPLKNLILKFLERNTHDLRTVQFAIRLRLPTEET
jgi:2-polyprenyl-3-methyl-5-hydroxy-6-metoxy-1,4-benzoquinol methylase